MVLSDEAPGAIEEVGLGTFQLYPTVSYGEITVKAEFGKNVQAQVNVVTPLGTAVWSKRYYGTCVDDVVSTADMPSGIYYLVLSTEEGKTTKPFIVKK